MAAPTRTRLALTNLLQTAADAGLETPTLKTARDTPQVLGMDERVPMEVLYAIWEELIALGASPALACRTALDAQPQSRNVVRMLASSAPTIGVALETTRRFWPLVTDAYGFTVDVREDAVYLVFDPIPSRVGARLDVVFTMTSLVQYARAWTDGAVSILRVELATAAGLETDAIAAELGIPVVEGRSRDALVLASGTLERALVRADAGLFEHLHAEVARALEGMPTTRSWSKRTWAELEHVARDRAPLQATARRLATTPRTLRRRLVEEGTSFASLLERWRAETAARLLSGWGDDDLATHLGFRDVRAFRRAFRRWNGRTPSDARRGPEGSSRLELAR